MKKVILSFSIGLITGCLISIGFAYVGLEGFTIHGPIIGGLTTIAVYNLMS